MSLEASQVQLGLSGKRSALEAMALKISLPLTKTRLHWVRSEAQLADVMTKSSGPGRNRWRIMFDPRMRSARKRKMEGLDLLEAHSDEHLNEDELDTSVHRQQ